MKLNEYDILLLKKPKKIISKIICLVTKNQYFHSEIYIGNYHIIDSMPNGVKVRNFDSSLCEFDSYRYYREISEEEKRLIEEFLQKAINCKYGFVELILQLFHIHKKQNKKYICISLIINAFQYAGLEIDDWQIGFKQISDSKYFIKV